MSLRPLLLVASLVLVGSRATAQACDSASLKAPTGTRVDTLRFAVRGADLPRLPRPWLDLLLDEIGTRLVLPTPLGMPVYGDMGSTGSPHAGETSPTMSNEVRLDLRRDGHLAAAELVTRSLSDDADLALLRAVHAADSAGTLLPLADSAAAAAHARDHLSLFLSLGMPRLPAEVRSLLDETAGDVAVLHLPSFAGAQPVRPTPGMHGPHYPVDERNAHREGDVAVQFVVDERGAMVPGTLRVLGYTSVAFARAVYDMLTHAHFEPATIGGCPVKALVAEPFQFRLSPSPPL